MIKENILNKLKQSLSKTRDSFIEKLNFIFNKQSREDIIEELTSLLLSSDIGFETTDKIINSLKKKYINNKNDLLRELFNILYNILNKYEKNIIINDKIKPFIILIIGINGSGKTTTVAKLSNLFYKNNKKIIIAAGDTYRKTSIEQLEILTNKNNIKIVKQDYGADSASVVFDAINTSIKNKIDLLIIDTAGRLHTNDKLMKQLKKIETVIKKIDKTAPHETLLIIDATLGQYSLNQAKAFNTNINITGIIITKLDGTAKAGIIFSIVENIKIPIKYICYGENIENIKEFNSKEFINSILNTDF